MPNDKETQKMAHDKRKTVGRLLPVWMCKCIQIMEEAGSPCQENPAPSDVLNIAADGNKSHVRK